MTATPKPTPPPVPAGLACGHCKRELATNTRGSHCPQRRTPCGWVKCSCGATVDLRTRNHDHPTHHNNPRPSWPCERSHR